jgi:branched-chain amino acid transport system ATP-binding protein
MDLLEIESLHKSFGGLAAVQNLSFQVKQGEIRGLIGPNGAGKTTTFNLISGFYRPSAGKIVYRGKNISGLEMNQIARRGLVRTFQGTTLFHELSVLDNVLIGLHLKVEASWFTRAFGPARVKEDIAKASEILESMGLLDRADDLAKNLPHGHQRALGICVALAAEPTLLMLDEPFAGMNAEETRQMMEHLRRLQDSGITILLVEHDMQAVMGLCNYITVLSFGKLLAEGVPEEIRSNKDVIEAYLGGA